MPAMGRQKQIHRLFVLSLALKGLHALAEIAGGLSLYLLGTAEIVHWLYRAGNRSPQPLAALAVDFARTFSVSEHHFYAFYLVSHGAVNIALVIGLLKRQRWAYPATFAVLSVFIAYQMHRYVYTHDLGLIVLTILDLVVMCLAWSEYRLRPMPPIAGTGIAASR
jgi:uncharacterized membrane protein